MPYKAIGKEVRNTLGSRRLSGSCLRRGSQQCDSNSEALSARAWIGFIEKNPQP